MARPASDIDKRILTSARARFLREGVDGASLRQIAKDAGTNIGMVYYYFKTKDELFLAVVSEVYIVLLADLTRVLDNQLPEEQRFAPLYQRLSQLSPEEFDVLCLILREALVSSSRLKSLGELFLRGHIPVVLGHITQGVQHERLRGDLPPMLLMAATLLLGIMPQVVRRVVGASDSALAALLPSPSEIARTMSEVLLRGITPPASARTEQD